MEAQEGTMDDHDDPFKEMADDGEDDNAVDELAFDLNQLCEVRPDIAPDREVVTNESQPLPVDEIVTEYLPQLV